jgi:hypothetical protein
LLSVLSMPVVFGRFGAPRSPRARHAALFVLSAAAFAFAGACAVPSQDERLGAAQAAGTTAFPNDKTAFDYFRGKGFTSVEAAGIVGNLDQESGLDPTIAQQGGGPGRGIAQWSAGGRWDTDPGDNLVAFAAQEGQSQDSLGVQLDFILYELQKFPSYGLAKLQATTNVTDAATDFELDFEGCGVPSECDVNSRISYAQAVLDAYGNDPVAIDAGMNQDAAAPPADAAPPSVHPDAAKAEEAGAGTGSSEDAGSAGPGALALGQAGSGCTVATRTGGRAGDGLGWLVAIGFLLGIVRSRRAQTASR